MGNPDRYLTVYTSTDVGYGPNGNLLYSVFNINANSGNGDLVLKNQIPNPLSSPIIANEMITYAPNATGDGFWIISGINNDTCSTTSFSCISPELRIYAIEVTFPDGDAIQFSAPIISRAAPLFNGFGSIEFNNDYSRALVLSGYFSGATPFNKGGILTEVNFKAATGAFTQRWILNLPFLPDGQKYYYADYSTNGQFAFVSTVFGDRAYRYDLTSANAATILSTES